MIILFYCVLYFYSINKSVMNKKYFVISTSIWFIYLLYSSKPLDYSYYLRFLGERIRKFAGILLFLYSIILLLLLLVLLQFLLLYPTIASILSSSITIITLPTSSSWLCTQSVLHFQLSNVKFYFFILSQFIPILNNYFNL